MSKPYVLTSSRDEHDCFCIHVRIEERYWQMRFAEKPDAQNFMRKNEVAIRDILVEANLQTATDATFSALDNIFNTPFRRMVFDKRRVYMLFTREKALRTALHTYDFSDEEISAINAVRYDIDVSVNNEEKLEGFVICVEQAGPMSGDIKLPMVWHQMARSIYTVAANSTEVTTDKETANFASAIRMHAHFIKPYKGRLGFVFPSMSKAQLAQQRQQSQLAALQAEPLYKEFAEAGYTFYEFPNAPKPLEHEMPGVMQKWIYSGNEKAFKINLHFSDLYDIEGYPKESVRFLYEVKLNLDNAFVGRTLLAGILTRYRVSSVAEAEDVAIAVWKNCGSPMP